MGPSLLVTLGSVAMWQCPATGQEKWRFSIRKTSISCRLDHRWNRQWRPGCNREKKLLLRSVSVSKVVVHVSVSERDDRKDWASRRSALSILWPFGDKHDWCCAVDNQFIFACVSSQSLRKPQQNHPVPGVVCLLKTKFRVSTRHRFFSASFELVRPPLSQVCKVVDLSLLPAQEIPLFSFSTAGATFQLFRFFRGCSFSRLQKQGSLAPDSVPSDRLDVIQRYCWTLVCHFQGFFWFTREDVSVFLQELSWKILLSVVFQCFIWMQQDDLAGAIFGRCCHLQL